MNEFEQTKQISIGSDFFFTFWLISTNFFRLNYIEKNSEVKKYYS